MSPAEMRGSVFDAVLADWAPDPLVYIAAAIASFFYLRGWWILHQRVPDRFGHGRLVAFMAGQAALLLAIGSPLDAFADLLLQAHMAQHWLLMMVAPPLLWLGSPQIAILRGLPSSWRKEGLGPFLAWPPLQKLGRFLGHPVTAWIFFVVASWAWHAPALYELALSSETWHQVEHFFFLSGALLFWWPVVQPWPSHPVWPRWALIPYLVLAAVQNTILAAVFAFSNRLFYPHYATVPQVFDLSPLDDQRAAGALLWVASALVLLPAASILVVKALGSRTLHAPTAARPRVAIGPGPDVLRWRVLGRVLRSRVFRRVLQFGCFGVAVAIILDGWWGPQRMSASNLAGVVPWTYWRGMVVVGLLVAGSLFCMACPFTLPRGLAKRLLGERFEWPRALRNKWPAIALLILYFALVEGLEVWSSPWGTAWLVFGYFAAAFAVDGIFSGASFCKYLCPAGQFQFALASVSPLEVRALDATTCQRCRTKDCLRGNQTTPGCPTELLLPTKKGNWDCTLCMDCVRACPEDNIGLMPVAPGLDLVADPIRSSLGRLSQRLDVAALALLLTLGAFANAASMAEPVVRFGDRIAEGVGSLALTTGFATALSMTVIPAVLVAACAWTGGLLGRVPGKRREVAIRFSLSLLPLGFSMWLAHYALHLYSGFRSVAPAGFRAARDLGVLGPGAADFSLSMAQGGSASVARWEVTLLGLGLLLSLYIAWRIARAERPRTREALGLFLPWAALDTLLYAAGVWIFTQPMLMRGTLL